MSAVNNEETKQPTATLRDAVEELPLLALLVVMANVAAAAILAREAYRAVAGERRAAARGFTRP